LPVVAWDLRGSHSRNSPRGIASPVFRLRREAPRSKGRRRPVPALRKARQTPIDSRFHTENEDTPWLLISVGLLQTANALLVRFHLPNCAPWRLGVAELGVDGF
jgi:hypothetical protein